MRQLWRHALLAVLVATTGGTGVMAEEDRPPGLSDAKLTEFVDGRIGEWEVRPEDRRFDEIGWTTSLLAARRLSGKHGRPVFLFTHDGRMAIGRC